MTSDEVKSALMLAAAGAAAYVLWRSVQGAGAAVDSVAAAASTVGGWVNPTADTNLAYRGVNALGSLATGDTNWTLGSATYDAVQGAKTELTTWSANPASPQNPYYQTVNAAGAKLTGEPGWYLGGAIYDLLNPAYIP